MGGFHGVDHEFLSAIEDQHDPLQHPTVGVGTEPEMPALAVIIKVLDPGRPCCGSDRVTGIDRSISHKLDQNEGPRAHMTAALRLLID